MTWDAGRSPKRGSSTWIGLAAAASLLVLQTQACRSAGPAQGIDIAGIAPDAALRATLPKRIIQAGVLVVGSDTSYAPWEYLSAEDGRTPEGIDVDIAEAISRKLGLKLDFQTAQFDAIIPGLGTKYDLGISAFTITKERMQAVDFVSYFRSVNLWVIKSGNPSKFDASNVCGRRVATQTGSAEEESLKRKSQACVQQGKPALEFVPFETVDQCFTRVATGGVDAMVAASSVAGYAVEQSNGGLTTMPAEPDLTDAALDGIAVAKSDPALTAAVAKAIDELMADGTYAKIFDKWGVRDVGVDQAKVDPDAP